MWFGIAIVEAVAIIFAMLATYISKGNLSLIHEYHTKNIRDINKKPYAKLYSKGLFVIAFFCFISGFFMYFEMTILGLMSIFLGILIGCLFFTKAQKKYNV